jgi:glycosyltransferase involved in cell wall biosynthesis
MKRILIITYYWPPAGGAPVQRWLKLAKYLLQEGVEPIVVTVDESLAGYPLTDASLNNEVPAGIRVYRTKTWEPFEIYRKLTGKKSIAQTGFIDDRKPSFTEKTMRFIRGNFFIPDARVGWNRFAFKQCEKIIRSEKIDAIITNSPPHSSQLIGYKLKKKYNLQWIADFRDPWTDIHYYPLMYHTPLAKKIDAGHERKVLLKADKVLVVSQGMKEIFAAKAPAIDDKTLVIPNGYDDADFDFPSTSPSDHFLITHTGSISEHFNINGFVKALRRTCDRYPEVPFRIRFTGNMDVSVQRLFEAARLNNILEVQPFQPHKEITRMLKSSTMLFMAIIDSAQNKGLISAKFFEYLASGKPMVCVAPKDGDIVPIIEACQAGKAFDYYAEDEMFAYLCTLVEKWKVNPAIDNMPNAAKEMFSRKNQAKRIAEIIS